MKPSTLLILASILALGACDYSNTSATETVSSIGLSLKKNDFDGYRALIDGDAAATYGTKEAFNKLNADFKGVTSIWADQVNLQAHEADTAGLDVTRNYTLVIKAKDANNNIRDFADATVFCHVATSYYDNTPSWPSDNSGSNWDPGYNNGGFDDSDRHRDEPGEGPGGGHSDLLKSVADYVQVQTESCTLTSIQFR